MWDTPLARDHLTKRVGCDGPPSKPMDRRAGQVRFTGETADNAFIVAHGNACFLSSRCPPSAAASAQPGRSGCDAGRPAAAGRCRLMMSSTNVFRGRGAAVHMAINLPSSAGSHNEVGGLASQRAPASPQQSRCSQQCPAPTAAVSKEASSANCIEATYGSTLVEWGHKGGP